MGRIFGARIVMQPTTLLMLGLLAYFIGTRGGEALNRGTFMFGLMLAVLLVLSVFIHELAHAATAKALGRQVHEVVLTLWGGHTSFDARGLTPRVSGLTAAAGPIANFALAGMGWAIVLTGMLDAATFPFYDGDISVRGLVTYLVWANTLLAVFNALPGIPLDGGRVLEAVVWGVTGNRYRGLIVAAWGGRVVAIGVILVILALPLAQGSSPTLWNLVVGMLIFTIMWPAATAALRGARTMNRREGVTAGSLMVPAIPINFDATVEQAHEKAHMAGSREVVVLAGDGTPSGHFPVALMDAVPPDAHATTGLHSVTMPLPRGAMVQADLTGDSLIDELQQWWGRTDVWAVSDNGEVVGVVQLSEVMQALK